MPVFANRVAGSVLSDSVADLKLEHLKAHLTMEFRPSEQIKAHNKTDKTMTTLASKPLLLLYGSVGSTGLLADAAAGVAAAGCVWESGSCSRSLLE